jgi:hypothetical protein
MVIETTIKAMLAIAIIMALNLQNILHNNFYLFVAGAPVSSGISAPSPAVSPLWAEDEVARRCSSISTIW